MDNTSSDKKKRLTTLPLAIRMFVSFVTFFTDYCTDILVKYSFENFFRQLAGFLSLISEDLLSNKVCQSITEIAIPFFDNDLKYYKFLSYHIR